MLFIGSNCTDIDQGRSVFVCDVTYGVFLYPLPGTYDTVIDMITASFDSVARSSIGRVGGPVVTDLSTHHCWQFPPVDEVEGMSHDQQNSMLAIKTCNCGAVALTELPHGCQWRCLKPGELVPNVLVEAATMEQDKGHSHCVSAVDLCFIKMKAVELSGELASNLLRIAYVLRAAT